jgi:hypothetical protein
MINGHTNPYPPSPRGVLKVTMDFNTPPELLVNQSGHLIPHPGMAPYLLMFFHLVEKSLL